MKTFWVCASIWVVVTGVGQGGFGSVIDKAQTMTAEFKQYESSHRKFVREIRSIISNLDTYVAFLGTAPGLSDPLRELLQADASSDLTEAQDASLFALLEGNSQDAATLLTDLVRTMCQLLLNQEAQKRKDLRRALRTEKKANLDLSSTLEQVQTSKDQLSAQLDSTVSSLNKQVQENQSLNGVLSQKNASYDQLAAELAAKRLYCSSLEAQCSSLQEDLNRTQSGFNQTKNELSVSRQRVEEVSQHNKTLEDEKRKLEEGVAAKESSLKSLSLSYKQAQKEVVTLKQEVSSLNETIGKNCRSLSLIRSEADEKSRQLDSFQKVFEDVSLVFEGEESEVGGSILDGSPISKKGVNPAVFAKDLPGVVRDLLDQNRSLEEDIKSQQSQLKEARDEVLQERIEKLDQRSLLQEKIDELEQDKRNNKQALRKRMQLESHLRKKLDLQRKEMKQLEQDVKSAEQKNQEQEKEYNHKIFERDQKISDQNKEIERQKNEIDRLQKSIKNAEQKNREQGREYDLQISERNQKILDQDNEIKRQKKEINAGNKTIEEQRAKLGQKERALKNKEDEYNSFKKKVTLIKEKVNEVKKKREETRQENDDLKKEMEKLQKKLDEVSQKAKEERLILTEKYNKEVKILKVSFEEFKRKSAEDVEALKKSHRRQLEEELKRKDDEVMRICAEKAESIEQDYISKISSAHLVGQARISELEAENQDLRQKLGHATQMNKDLKARLTYKNPASFLTMGNNTPKKPTKSGKAEVVCSTVAPQKLQQQNETLEKRITRLEGLLERYRVHLPQLRKVFGSLNVLLQKKTVKPQDLDQMRQLVNSSSVLLDPETENGFISWVNSYKKF